MWPAKLQSKKKKKKSMVCLLEPFRTRQQWKIPSTLSKWNCNSIFIYSIRNSLNINRMSTHRKYALWKSSKTNHFHHTAYTFRYAYRIYTCTVEKLGCLIPNWSHPIQFISTDTITMKFPPNWTTFRKMKLLEIDRDGVVVSLFIPFRMYIYQNTYMNTRSKCVCLLALFDMFDSNMDCICLSHALSLFPDSDGSVFEKWQSMNKIKPN